MHIRRWMLEKRQRGDAKIRKTNLVRRSDYDDSRSCETENYSTFNSSCRD